MEVGRKLRGHMRRIGQAPNGPFDAYQVVPTEGRNLGIVLVAEMFGVTQAMKIAADYFADHGFPTIVPNLFWRYEPSGVLEYEGADRETAFNRLSHFETGPAVADIRIAATAFGEEKSWNGKIAALGFCVGGRIASAAAVEGAVNAAVGFYGLGVSQYGERLGALTVPLQLHYGLDDKHVPREEVDAVTRLAAGNSHVDVHHYADIGHSFCNPMRPTFNKAAADVALGRAVAFLSAQG